LNHLEPNGELADRPSTPARVKALDQLEHRDHAAVREFPP
jgi:hypothetical protein